MKLTVLLSGLLLTTSHCLFAQGTPVSGQQLEIGPAGSDQVLNNAGAVPSGAIGSGNQVRLFGSLAVGTSNFLGGTIGSGQSGGWNAMALGVSNYVFSSCSLAIGNYNQLQGGDENYPGGNSSLIVGTGNYSGGVGALIVGTNNYIPRYYEVNQDLETRNIALVGHGLVSIWPQCLIAGQYNVYETLGGSPLFVLGMGSDSNNRANAFEVYNNGAIRMARQGDILMGEFGNP